MRSSDWSSDVCSSELISIVDALDGYEVDGSIVSFGGEAFPSLLDESRFFFMTDMENESPSDAAFLPDSAREALSYWVDAGGVMVMTGTYGDDDTTFLTLVFGGTLATSGASRWAKTTAGTTGTPFDAHKMPSRPPWR